MFELSWIHMKTGYRKEVKLDMCLEQIGNKLNILGMVQTSDVNNILIEGLENPPCTNLRIQDGGLFFQDVN